MNVDWSTGRVGDDKVRSSPATQREQAGSSSRRTIIRRTRVLPQIALPMLRVNAVALQEPQHDLIMVVHLLGVSVGGGGSVSHAATVSGGGGEGASYM